MTPSQIAQAACDKLSFSDSATLALAKKFCIRRYSMIWDTCLWNDTLGVISKSVAAQDEVIKLDGYVTSAYSPFISNSMYLDLPIAIRFTVNGDSDGIELPASEWQSFFQLDPNTWNNVESRRATPGNFINLSRLINDGTTTYGDSGIPQDRKSTRLNSSHSQQSRMPSSA